MKKFFPNLIYLLLCLPMGILYFVVLVTGFSLGAGLAITLIGLPILATMIIVTYLLGDLERATTSKLLGISIAKPEARPAKDDSIKSILAAQLKNPNFWKELVYLLLKMPLGVIAFSVAIIFVFASVAFILAPLTLHYFPDANMVLVNQQIDTMPKAFIFTGLGLILSPVTVVIVNGLAKALGWLTTWALGKAS